MARILLCMLCMLCALCAPCEAQATPYTDIGSRPETYDVLPWRPALSWLVLAVLGLPWRAWRAAPSTLAPSMPSTLSSVCFAPPASVLRARRLRVCAVCAVRAAPPPSLGAAASTVRQAWPAHLPSTSASACIWGSAPCLLLTPPVCCSSAHPEPRACRTAYRAASLQLVREDASFRGSQKHTKLSRSAARQHGTVRTS